jgi:hypothetical protein
MRGGRGLRSRFSILNYATMTGHLLYLFGCGWKPRYVVEPKNNCFACLFSKYTFIFPVIVSVNSSCLAISKQGLGIPVPQNFFYRLSGGSQAAIHPLAFLFIAELPITLVN